jgi:hypothetical protein
MGGIHAKGLAITDHHASVVAPTPVAPVHETDMLLWPRGLNALQQGATQVEADLRGASLNLDGGCDAAARWDEGAGVDEAHPASVLRSLILATSAWPRHAVTPPRTTARWAVLATSDPGRTAAVPTPG